MKSATLLFLMMVCGIGPWCSASDSTPDAGVAVVELFTSEGCSSCPPAERVLGELARTAERAGRPVFTLAFHVDYWNRLGWADRFSDRAFSRRQEQYAKALNLSEIYTPQMVVNGTAQFVGSDRRAADEAIAKALAKAKPAPVVLNVSGNKRDGYRVHTTVKDVDPATVVNVAVVEQGLSTDVKSGENGGRRLDEPSVVRWFKSVPFSEGKEIIVPSLPEVRAQNASVIVYVQRPETGMVLALQVRLCLNSEKPQTMLRWDESAMSSSTPSFDGDDKVTPLDVYLNRRTFIKAGAVAAAVGATAWAYRRINALPPATAEQPALAGLESPTAAQSSYPPAIAKAFRTDEEKTPFQSITHYNNFYEFSTDKDGVAGAIGDFSTKGWKVTVDGLVTRPTTFDLDDIRKISPLEARVYRMRCVEAWSMVIPWAGYPLAKLLDRVQPLSEAKYVAFTTLLDSKMMPGQRTDVLQWPYVEGLRMDEAMHPLTLLTTGLYGRELPVQDGAPVRVVIPWKYGFKGIKSIVKISLVAEQPVTSWNRYAPDEYGFYANVNPNHAHPRWSQATEQRIGESGRRPTLMFNGYGEQVASLYAGMDLDKYF